jgi:hypothetical protein
MGERSVSLFFGNIPCKTVQKSDRALGLKRRGYWVPAHGNHGTDINTTNYYGVHILG